jgi:hypothetical protein
VETITVKIKTTTQEAKRMLDFLRTQKYAQFIEADIPNEKTRKAIIKAKTGKTAKFKNFDDYKDKTK